MGNAVRCVRGCAAERKSHQQKHPPGPRGLGGGHSPALPASLAVVVSGSVALGAVVSDAASASGC